ncbi:TRAP transporter small permease [Aquincola sp. MAHUQ-54]|uniref:TRAP transporter small permease protein n=1 Tax=Aquincola agrisoli TaxID=3119538 RepID=A0AAW9QFF6_9BURK
MTAMETNKGPIQKLVEHLMVLGMSIMGLMVLGNVILRYVFNSGLEISEEVSRFIFVWLTFLGSIIALKTGVHLGVDTLVRRLPRRARLVCYWLSHALMLWCCWLIWKGSWELTKNNLHNVSAISGIPVAAMYGSGLVASALMALILAGNLWRSLRGDLREEAVSPEAEYSVSHEQEMPGSAR